MRIKNLCSLNIDEEVESKLFEIRGNKWCGCLSLNVFELDMPSRKIGLLLSEHNSGLYDSIKVVLMSCNKGAVGTHAGLDVQLNGHPISEEVVESVQH